MWNQLILCMVITIFSLLQPPKSIIAQVQMQHTVPVHSISFNCNDKEANEFLFDLAKATGGRYHYFSEKGKDLDQPESWEVIIILSPFSQQHKSLDSRSVFKFSHQSYSPWNAQCNIAVKICLQQSHRKYNSYFII